MVQPQQQPWADAARRKRKLWRACVLLRAAGAVVDGAPVVPAPTVPECHCSGVNPCLGSI
ncbi:hypothetical protein PAHAL_8G044500 [Panicum hallii]|uniref:Uncharacterized protein n=1 Tax=Panicum hallii TaxID=206008 RepID=A0A2T8I7N3_9POAL|nr:hypothetical protein PAHAL_8G044500 [Panicum hallii]